MSTMNHTEEERWHGTLHGYNYHACRCDRCTKALRTYRARTRLKGSRSETLRSKYRLAREAGFSGAEARQRQHRANPLA